MSKRIDKPVLEFASAQRWRATLDLELPHMAVENYLWALQVFCKWSEKNPDELILERKKEMAARLKGRNAGGHNRVIAYQLADRSKTKHSKSFIVKAVSSFYEKNYARTNDRKIAYAK